MNARNTLAEPPHTADPDVAQSVEEAWVEFLNHLAWQSNELIAEVRNYPTPIARCDDQLPKLLEQRGCVIRQLKAAIELGPYPAAGAAEAGWLEQLHK